MKPLALALMLIFCAPLARADDTQEARYRALIAELRCLVCQNQSLADSNAELAADMRREVRALIDQGKSDSEIVQYLVARYGDFVRYRPPLKTSTVLLWAGPFALLALGLGVTLLRVRHARPAAAPLSDDEAQRLQQLLGEDRKP
jgi:cytochrome c-type biogenesis protein CcmH